MEFTELKKHLSLKKYHPCYVLAGEDAFVLRRATEMLEAVAKLPDFNLSLFNEEARGSEVALACQQLPVMCEYRVVEAENLKKDIAAVAEYLKDPCPSTLLVLKYPGGLDANLKKLSANLEIVNCAKLPESVIVKWIGGEVNAAGAAITAPAAQKLITLCSGDMTRISSELQKLISATSEPISETLVTELVTADNDYKIYELGEALASLNADKTYAVYEGLLDGMPASGLITSLYGYFRRLLYAAITNDPSLATYLGVKEYAVTMAVRQGKQFGARRLKAIVDRLNEIDRDFKSGRADDRSALDAFIAETLLQSR